MYYKFILLSFVLLFSASSSLMAEITFSNNNKTVNNLQEVKNKKPLNKHNNSRSFSTRSSVNSSKSRQKNERVKAKDNSLRSTSLNGLTSESRKKT